MSGIWLTIVSAVLGTALGIYFGWLINRSSEKRLKADNLELKRQNEGLQYKIDRLTEIVTNTGYRDIKEIKKLLDKESVFDYMCLRNGTRLK